MADSRVGRGPGKRGASKSAASGGSKKSARRKKTPSRARKDRAMEDRAVTESRVLSDEERLDEFRKSFFKSVLPDLPQIPGYHVCWLTTTNSRDSVPGRMRLGYEPIKASDIPGWEHAAMKSGEYAGCIGVNELVAFKLPMSLYEAYMREVHHTQPLQEEQKLSSVIDVIREEAAQVAKSGSRGVRMYNVEEGTAELGEERDPGSFAENLGEVSEGSGF